VDLGSSVRAGTPASRPDAAVKEQPAPTPEIRRPVLHPAAHEEWFKKLPHERRASMNRVWRAGLARDRELGRNQRRVALGEALRVGTLFAIGNGFCPGDAGWTYAAAFAVGAAVGLVLERLRAARPLSGVLGLAAFFLYQCVSRRGASLPSLFVSLLVGLTVAMVSAHLAMRRELE
jgi:hypothetical protein